MNGFAPDDVKKLRQMEKCRNCFWYDSSPFPEYEGKLAICRNKSPADGMNKIGYNTVASKICFKPKD